MKFLVTPFQIEDIARCKMQGAYGAVFATPFFSVRGCSYFEVEQYPMLKEVCQQNDIKMFVRVNRFFFEEELPTLEKHLQFLKELDVDGIYFTDESVLYLAQKLQMEDRLIYQSDTLMTNHMDANYYLGEHIKSVVLAKEITLEEILSIAKHTNAQQLEVFIHGRACMMHSKRTLLSNYMQFMQKDIDVYEKRTLSIQEANRDVKMPILEDRHGTHVFSGYLQNFFHEIEALKQADIGYVSIDGIFMDFEYVLFVLHLYQAILHHDMTAQEAMEKHQDAYPDVWLDSGFLYRKTSKTK